MKNVACLLSDRSRALAQAYVLKRQDDILFGIIKHSVYGKIKIYARPKITFVPPSRGGGGLNGN